MIRRWISVRECATYVGIHEKSVYRLIDRGEIPASKIGGSVRVDLKRLEVIMLAREQQIRGSK